MIDCKHWKKCGVVSGGCCSINEYERPSFGVCILVCKKNTSPPTKKQIKKLQRAKPNGFGDTIKNVIDKITGGKIKQCGGCKKRQEALNKLMPYKDNENGN